MILLKTTGYLAAYFFGWFILYALLFGVFEGLHKLATGKTFTQQEEHGYITEHGCLPVLVVFFLLFGTLPAPYYAFRHLGYTPPFARPSGQLSTEQAATNRLSSIVKEAEAIKVTLSHVEQMSIRDIQQQLTSIVKFLGVLQQETAEQERVVAELFYKANEQTKQYEEARRSADSVKSLTQPQLDAVKLLVTQNAREESSKSFLLGTMVSFPIGFMTSLLASWVYSRVGRKRKDGNA